MGLLASAIGGAGEGLATVGKKYGDYLEHSNLQAEMADIQSKRDSVLEGFARGREERGQEFQKGQQEASFGHAEKMQGNQQDFQAIQSDLTRDQQSSESKLNRDAQMAIAKLGRDTQLAIAKSHGTVQIGEGGKILWVGQGGEVKDTGFISQKDLSPSAKVAADILRDQLKAVDKEEAGGLGDAGKFAAQRTRLNGQLLAVLSGDVDKAFGAPAAGAAPQGAIDALKKNPNLASQFDAKYGAGASTKHLAPAPAGAPGAPGAAAAPAPSGLLSSDAPSAQQQRETEMRAEYDRDQKKKQDASAANMKEFRDNIERTRLRSEM